MTDTPRTPDIPIRLLAEVDKLEATVREYGPRVDALMEEVFAQAEREDLAALDEIEGPADLEW